MPTYEYACPDCGHEFEAFHAMSAAPVKLCPKCGKKKVKRLMSAGSGLIFKGSGFYITDYRSEGYKQAAKKESEAAKPTAGDGKPAQTKPDKPSPKSHAKSAGAPAAGAA